MCLVGDTGPYEVGAIRKLFIIAAQLWLGRVGSWSNSWESYHQPYICMGHNGRTAISPSALGWLVQTTHDKTILIRMKRLFWEILSRIFFIICCLSCPCRGRSRNRSSAIVAHINARVMAVKTSLSWRPSCPCVFWRCFPTIQCCPSHVLRVVLRQ